jgi:hypothetical protein
MIVLNLEVIHINRLSSFFNEEVLNNQVLTINAYKDVTNEKISCVDKASVLDVERVVNG